MSDFRGDLEQLINFHSQDNGSDTPDFILADYLVACLAVFDATVKRRDQWYGVDHWKAKRGSIDGEVKP